jgi:hypothetical protein
MAVVPLKLSLKKKPVDAAPTQAEVVEEPVAPKRLIKKVEDEQMDLFEDAPAKSAAKPAPETVEEEMPKPKKLAVAEKTPAPQVEEAEEELEIISTDPSDRALTSFSPMAMGTIDGAISERDLLRPRIMMVQANSSDLEERGYTVGQIVLNGQVLIWDKGFDPLNMVLMTGRKKFIQKLSDEEYKEGVIPMIFETPKDAEAAGFTTEWENNEPPTVDPALFCLFLLQQPDYIEPDPIFNMEFDGKAYTLAEMRFSGVNFRSSSAGRWLMTQTRTSLAPDSRHFSIGMTCSREKQKSGNIVTVASFRNQGRHKNPRFIEWVLSLA